MPQYPLRGWLFAFPPLPERLTAPRPSRDSDAMRSSPSRPRPPGQEPECKPNPVARPAAGSEARGSTNSALIALNRMVSTAFGLAD